MYIISLLDLGLFGEYELQNNNENECSLFTLHEFFCTTVCPRQDILNLTW